VVTSSHDEDAYRLRIWRAYKCLVINADDERLSAEERNGVIAIGNRIFEEGKPHGQG
jgi:hypothetical protein